MGLIRGVVRSTTNRPLPDVNLVIVSGPPHADIVAITGTDGTFELNNLRPGRYVIKAYGRVESDDIPVRVFAQQVPFVEIWLETAGPERNGNVVEEENFFEGESYFDEESYFSEDGRT